MKVLFDGGLVVEPSGAAAFSALLTQKIPELNKGSEIVILISGSNITPQQLNDIIN